MNSEELAANVDDQHPMGCGYRSDDSMNDERIFKVSRYSHFLSMGNNHGGLSKSIRRTEPTSSTNIPVTNISILCLRDEYIFQKILVLVVEVNEFVLKISTN